MGNILSPFPTRTFEIPESPPQVLGAREKVVSEVISRLNPDPSLLEKLGGASGPVIQKIAQMAIFPDELDYMKAEYMKDVIEDEPTRIRVAKLLARPKPDGSYVLQYRSVNVPGYARVPLTHQDTEKAARFFFETNTELFHAFSFLNAAVNSPHVALANFYSKESLESLGIVFNS